MIFPSRWSVTGARGPTTDQRKGNSPRRASMAASALILSTGDFWNICVLTGCMNEMQFLLLFSIHSFAGLDAAKSSIKSLDTWMDLEKDYGLAGFKKATDLRKTWPHMKVRYTRFFPAFWDDFTHNNPSLSSQVMIAIGGWNEGSTKYSGMAKDKKKRQKFVKSTMASLQTHNFEGQWGHRI